jgi:predicted RNA binding protein YcfA (HicA-like mRNA interferase family)
MPRKLRQLRADLRALGFVLDRQRGSHQMWRHPSGAEVTLAGADGDDAQRYQERDLAQARAALVAHTGEATGRKD